MSRAGSSVSSSDDQTLFLIQRGDATARDEMFGRFDPLLRAMVGRACPQRAARQPDFVDDVVGESYRLILDPQVVRFNPGRGNSKKYLYGRVRNAVRTISRQRRAVCDGLFDRGEDARSDAPRSSGIVYHRTMSVRTKPMLDTTFEIEEHFRIAFHDVDTSAAQMAFDHLGLDEAQVSIAARFGISHTSVGRRMKQFLDRARRRLTSRGAA